MADVLVGFDGSASAGQALDTAIELAKATGDRIVLVFGFADPVLGGESADMRAALVELGQARVAEGSARVVAAGLPVDEVIAESEPAEALAELATERQARMIVVGSRGEGRVRGLLLGSTPYRLVHLSTVPVLVVPVSG